jgi:cyclopropane fatty-acyl-phospholipid synthase-like methyltransferase
MIDFDQCQQFSRNHPQSRDSNTVQWIKSKSQVHGKVLDIGCGPARLDIMLCDTFPNIVIHAIDGSHAMLEIAKNNIETENLQSKIQVAHCDVKDIKGEFDTVISSDTLHHMHDPLIFWHAIKRVAKSMTQIFVVDLVRPDNMDQVNRILKVLARTNDQIYIDDFRNSLCAAFSQSEINDQLNAIGLDDFEVAVVGDVCKTVYIHGIIK